MFSFNSSQVLPLKVYGSAVYRVGSDDMGGAFESVHETVVGFARVRAEGATEFSWEVINSSV